MSEQHVSATGGFAYGAVGADIHVFGDGTPLYVLRRWAPAPEADPQWLRQQPSRMLHARFAVAPFTGREDELGALHAWCAGGPQRGRWPHLGPACLYPLLAADPGLGVAAGGAALTALAELPDITTALLEDVVDAVLHPTPANLVVGRAAVDVRLFASRIAAAPDQHERAWLHAGHGNDLQKLGRTEEALRAARRGAELFQELAADDPETYEEHVGRILTHLAGLLHSTGEADEAVATQQRVVELFTRLVRDDLSRYEPYRATALANVSV